MRKLLLILALSVSPAIGQTFTFGTASKAVENTGATSKATGATFSASANATLYCGIASDDGADSTQVSSIVVSGSPTYSTAWQVVPTNGRLNTANLLDAEIWFAVATSAISSQTVTVTINHSHKFSFVCQSVTGTDLTNPIAASNNATGATTVNVTSSGHDNSTYLGLFACGDDTGRSFVGGANYTQDECTNCANEATVWSHTYLEHKTAQVTPAATTTVDMTSTGSCTNPRMFGVELALPAAAAGGSTVQGVFSVKGTIQFK